MARRTYPRTIRNEVVIAALVIVAVTVQTTLSFPARAIAYGAVDEVHTSAGAWIGERSDGSIGECSGVLVSAKVFLSAAHCVSYGFGVIPLNRMWVSLATNFWSDRKSWRAVSSFIVHPDYVFSPYVESNPHDLVAVILAKPVKDIAPAQLAPAGYLDELWAAGTIRTAMFQVVGYGADESGQPTYERRIIDAGFQSLQAAWLKMSVENKAAGACPGDSGGPTYLSQAGADYLVSIHIGSSACSQGGMIYDYRIDAPGAYAFILGAVAATS